MLYTELQSKVCCFFCVGTLIIWHLLTDNIAFYTLISKVRYAVLQHRHADDIAFLSETVSLQVSNTTKPGRKMFKSRKWLKSQSPMFVRCRSCREVGFLD